MSLQEKEVKHEMKISQERPSTTTEEEGESPSIEASDLNSVEGILSLGKLNSPRFFAFIFHSNFLIIFIF